jgi:hypothetical protein
MYERKCSLPGKLLVADVRFLLDISVTEREREREREREKI